MMMKAATQLKQKWRQWLKFPAKNLRINWSIQYYVSWYGDLMQILISSFQYIVISTFRHDENLTASAKIPEQMVTVTAAPPPHTDYSIVFARWRQSASLSNTWFLVPTRHLDCFGRFAWPSKSKVKFSHTRYRALGPELIPVYKQSAGRWREVNHAIDLAVGCSYFLPGLRLPP